MLRWSWFLVFTLVLVPQIHSENVACLCSGEIVGDEMLLAGGPDMQHAPALAFDAATANYLLVWNVMTANSQMVKARFFNFDGSEKGSTRNLFTTSSELGPGGVAPLVSYNRLNDEFGVLWTISDSAGCLHQVRGSILTSAGQLRANGKTIAQYDCSGESDLPEALLFNADLAQYLLISVNSAGTSIFAQYLDSDLEPIGDRATIMTVATGQAENVQARFDPVKNRYLVVWDFHGASLRDRSVQARMLYPDLSLPAPQHQLVSQRSRANARIAYQAATNRFVLLWQTTSSLQARYIRSDASFASATGTYPIRGHVTDVRPNPLTGGFLIAYMTDPRRDVAKLAQLDGGLHLDASEIALTCEAQTYPGLLAFNTQQKEFLAVWSYYDEHNSKNIYARRVRATPQGSCGSQ